MHQIVAIKGLGRNRSLKCPLSHPLLSGEKLGVHTTAAISVQITRWHAGFSNSNSNKMEGTVFLLHLHSIHVTLVIKWASLARSPYASYGWSLINNLSWSLLPHRYGILFFWGRILYFLTFLSLSIWPSTSTWLCKQEIGSALLGKNRILGLPQSSLSEV